MNYRGFLQLLKEPGIFFALGNACLFGLVNPFAFVMTLGTAVFIIACKYFSMRTVDNSILQKIIQASQKPYAGVEWMGYACLLTAILAMAKMTYIGFVSSLCFGFANLLIAQPRNKFNYQTVLANIQAQYSLTPLFLAIIREPVVLIALGIIHAGLAAGTSSIIIFPIMLFAAYYTLKNPEQKRTLAFSLTSCCCVIYSMIACSNHEKLAFVANCCFAYAYAQLAYFEKKESWQN